MRTHKYLFVIFLCAQGKENVAKYLRIFCISSIEREKNTERASVLRACLSCWNKLQSLTTVLFCKYFSSSSWSTTRDLQITRIHYILNIQLNLKRNSYSQLLIMHAHPLNVRKILLDRWVISLYIDSTLKWHHPVPMSKSYVRVRDAC